MTDISVLLNRKNQEEIARRARERVFLVIDYVIETMLGSDQLVAGEMPLDRRQRILVFEDLKMRGVLAEMIRLSPRLTQKVYVDQHVRDLRALGLED